MSEDLRSVIKDRKFRMDRLGDILRLTWGFQTFVEKFLLVAILLLGLWKLFELALTFIK